MPKSNGLFWFEMVTTDEQRETISQPMWLYCVGTDENTPVALVTGPNDYTACARARLITQALNDERRKALAASQEGDE